MNTPTTDTTTPEADKRDLAAARRQASGIRPAVFEVLGVPVSAIDLDRASGVIRSWVANDERTYVCVRDAHGIMLCRHDLEFLKIHQNAGLVTPDGMPLVWLGCLRGLSVGRVYGPDLLMRVCRDGVREGLRHAFYGGRPGVAERLVERLSAAIPGLRVAGAFCPPFRDLTLQEDEMMLGAINAGHPDVLWIGLGTPKQERWMAAHLGRVAAPVMIGVGAAFDFHSGMRRQAPRWIQRTGFEWLFRLATEPRRLWRRYLVTVPSFLWLAVGEAISHSRRAAR